MRKNAPGGVTGAPHKEKKGGAMLRAGLAIAVGFILGGVVIAIAEMIGHALFPVTEPIDLHDPEAIRAMMSSIPLGSKISVIVAWGLGVFAGGFAAVRVGEGRGWLAWCVAGGLFAGSVYSFMTIPHPLWMIVAAIVVMPAAAWASIPAAKFGR